MTDLTTLSIYRFRLGPAVPMDDVHVYMATAIAAGESVFGAARVRLEFGYCADDDKRSLVADGRTQIGYLVVSIFTGLLLKQFGLTDFSVEPVGGNQHAELLRQVS
jgi:hypothetical protein